MLLEWQNRVNKPLTFDERLALLRMAFFKFFCFLPFFCFSSRDAALLIFLLVDILPLLMYWPIWYLYFTTACQPLMVLYSYWILRALAILSLILSSVSGLFKVRPTLFLILIISMSIPQTITRQPSETWLEVFSWLDGYWRYQFLRFLGFEPMKATVFSLAFMSIFSFPQRALISSSFR